MICLLCVSRKRDMIEIFGDRGKALVMAEVIGKHFWFKLSSDDTPTKFVCKQCWKKTHEFHLFYCEVEENQPLLQHQQPSVDITVQVIGDYDKIVAKNEVKDEDAEETTGGKPPEDSVVKYEPFSDCSDDVNKSDNEQLAKEDDDNDDDYNDDDDDDDDEEEVFAERTKRTRSPITEQAAKRKKAKKTSKLTNPATEAMAKKKKERFLKNNYDQHRIMEYCKMQCEKCEVTFRDWYDVKNHYRHQHKMKGYVYCTCCNEKFTRRFRILDHIEYRSNPEAFQCEICLKNYEHRDSLQNHLLTHKPVEERQFKCDKCDKSYAKKGLLGAHIRTRHITEEEKMFACSECGSKFATQAILNSHVRGVHEGAYIHVCEICAKVFKSKMFFEKHKLNMHSISPPPKVQCQNCGNWLRESSMRSHVHSCHERQEKGLHVCDLCGKESPNSRALQSHKRFVHLAQKLHQCSVCDKAFKRAITLKEHMTVHTGEVLYSCTYCPKTFNSNANMHAHRKKNHKAQWEENQLRSK